MISLKKILILFIAVVTIGEVVDMHPDSNRPDDSERSDVTTFWTSESASIFKLSTVSDRKVNLVVGIDELSEILVRLKMSATDYTNIDRWMMWLLRTRLESPQTSPPVETTTTKFVINQHPGWRKRRQALVKLRGENDGSNSEVSFTNSSSLSNMNSNDINPNMSKIKLYNWLPRNLEIEAMKQVQKSLLKNRSRRSTEDAKMSSDKNNTVLADPNPANQGNIPINAMTCALYLRLPVPLPLKCVNFFLDSL